MAEAQHNHSIGRQLQPSLGLIEEKPGIAQVREYTTAGVHRLQQRSWDRRGT